MAFLAIILGLILIIGTHEAGHSLAARYFGVRILRISIGFGKPIVSWKSKNQVEWVWALFPIGGYVTLLNSRITTVPSKDLPYAFDKKPLYARIIILLSGALANILVAFCALTLVHSLGYYQSKPMVESVSSNSIAQNAGIHAHDCFIQIGDKPTPSWQTVGMALITYLNQNNVVVILKNAQGNQYETTIDLTKWHYKPQKQALLKGLGITPNTTDTNIEHVVGVNLIKAMAQALKQTTTLMTFFLIMIKQLVTGIIPLGVLLGPLSLFEAMALAFLEGISVFAYFIGTLSLAVALVNLLPIPGLDGGSILYHLIEFFRKKPLSIALEVLLHRLFFIAFCVLLVQLMMNDFRQLFV